MIIYVYAHLSIYLSLSLSVYIYIYICMYIYIYIHTLYIYIYTHSKSASLPARMMPSLPRVSSGYFACVVKQTGATVYVCMYVYMYIYILYVALYIIVSLSLFLYGIPLSKMLRYDAVSRYDVVQTKLRCGTTYMPCHLMSRTTWTPNPASIWRYTMM